MYEKLKDIFNICIYGFAYTNILGIIYIYDVSFQTMLEDGRHDDASDLPRKSFFRRQSLRLGRLKPVSVQGML